MSDRIMNSRKTRRRLAPSEKYEMFVSVLTGQATQREAAAKWAWTARRWCMFAGLRSRGRWMRWLPRCRAARGRARRGGSSPRRGGDRPAAGDGHRAGGGAAPARGKSRLGLTAGPVPPRVPAEVKAGLLDLACYAVEHGWAAWRACAARSSNCSRAGVRSTARTASWPAGTRGSGWYTCRSRRCAGCSRTKAWSWRPRRRASRRRARKRGLVPLDEAAESLGMCTTTVKAWHHEGRLVAQRVNQKGVHYCQIPAVAPRKAIGRPPGSKNRLKQQREPEPAETLTAVREVLVALASPPQAPARTGTANGSTHCRRCPPW